MPHRILAVAALLALAFVAPAIAAPRHARHHYAKPARWATHHPKPRRRTAAPAVAVADPIVTDAPIADTPVVPEPVAETATRVFPLVGQSNMIGQGRATQEPLPGVSILTDDGIGPATTDFFGADDTDGTGPGVEFARRLRAAHPDVRIVVVPCAVGGTEIVHWVPGGDLYERCVQMTRRALALTSGSIGGVLYWQGESDTTSVALAQGWEDSFRRFASGFRAAIGSPAAPLMMAVLGDTPYEYRYPGWSTVRDAQATMVLPANTARVQVNGLAMRDDLHYTVEANVTVGDRYLAALDGLR